MLFINTCVLAVLATVMFQNGFKLPLKKIKELLLPKSFSL